MFQKPFLRLLSISLLTSLVLSAQAAPHKPIVVIAPDCLLNRSKASYQVLAKTKNFALIEVNEKGLEKLIEAKHVKENQACGGFMDVSRGWEDFSASKTIQKNKPDLFLKKEIEKSEAPLLRKSSSFRSIRYESTVNKLLADISPGEMKTNLIHLSSYRDRYPNSQTGIQASHWVKDKIEALAKLYNRQDVTVFFVQTGPRYKQPSVVAKMGNSSEAGIVIGAHIDTLSGLNSRKPGADDDGSGSVTVLEAARTLFASGLQFKKPIYFMWYAAEEQGLVGSDYVINAFKKEKIPVASVIHFDMTAYTADSKDLTMWLITDHVDPDLTNFLETLINTYVKQPVKRTACGYACSDHASWTKAQIPAAMPFEAGFNFDNPHIHTSEDTWDKLSFEHMTDYAKLGVAFVAELAEPAA